MKSNKQYFLPLDEFIENNKKIDAQGNESKVIYFTIAKQSFEDRRHLSQVREYLNSFKVFYDIDK